MARTAPGAGITGEELRMLAAEIKFVHSHLLIPYYSIDPSTKIMYNVDCRFFLGGEVLPFSCGARAET